MEGWSGELAERLSAVEKRTRRLVRAVGLGLCALALPLIVAAEKGSEPKTVEATKVVLRDAKGMVRAELATQADGAPTLTFFDGKGGSVMTLRAVPAGPILEMADGSGGSVWLTSSSTGASLALSKGKGEIEVASNATGEPSIKLQDRDGKVVWHAP